MYQLPPPGWYPDPATAGRSWRWWDGTRWTIADHAYDPALRHQARERARRAGHWLRIAFVANAVAGIAAAALLGTRLYSTVHPWFTHASDGTLHLSHSYYVTEALVLPFSLVGIAVVAFEIAWLLRIGEYADGHGWPAHRNRTLGAWSLLIPIVSLWFPYQAICDGYPPGHSHGVALRWWLCNLILVPIAVIAVLIAGTTGNLPALVVTLVLATAAQIVVTLFALQLIDDVDAAQDAAAA